MQDDELIALYFSRSETAIAATHIVNDVVDDANITDDSYILDVVSKERGE